MLTFFILIVCALNSPTILAEATEVNSLSETILGEATEENSLSDNTIPHGDSNSIDLNPATVQIIPRSAWNAKEPLNTPNSSIFFFINVIIDHSLTQGCSDTDSCCSLIRSFQDFHMDDLNRDDIHYNFMISGDGSVYEGRGWNRAADIVEYSNDESIVISFIGNYRKDKPNEKQLSAAQGLIKDGLRSGKIQSNYGLYGVRQFCNNDSPGDALFHIIQTWPHFSSIRKN